MEEQLRFWAKSPKQFCDDANVAIAQGVGTSVLVAMQSGANAQVFAMTPEHAKRFLQLFTYTMTQYEETNGPIKVEDWTPEKKSPLQINDLQGGTTDSK